jgi:hypothetical protein
MTGMVLMNRKLISLILGFTLVAASLLGILAAGNGPVQAQSTVFTPTAQPDGRILYYVKENDTCIGIALLYLNGDTNKLVQLNNLDENCTIYPGLELMLGTYETPVPTEGPSPTPTEIIPTATPYNGNGAICVNLFNDINGNATPDDGELPIAGGAISIADREGLVSLNGITSGTVDEPTCFENIPEGEYNVSVGPPEGYNSTTSMNYPLTLIAGDSSLLIFGAQISSAGVVAEQTPEGQQSRSPLMAILGGVMILGGIGLGVYFVFLKTRSQE